jgi:endoglucanase
MSVRPTALACLLIAGAVLGGCGGGVAREPGELSAQAAASVSGAPLAGSALYVNPESQASVEVRQLQSSGDTHEAGLLQSIAAQPVATWFTNESPQLQTQVAALVNAASASDSVPTIVAYYIPQRDCGAGFSSGGAPTAAAYQSWIARLAAGIGSGRALVILEPDAVPDIADGCLSGGAAQARLGLLRQAVARIKRDPHARVYIDAGNAGWIKPSQRLIAPLRAAGVAKADGFALNVANFQSTGASVGYGNAVSRQLHGAHFVIDTSRNGNGVDDNPADAPTWCDPPGRALGRRPTTSTGIPRVDAFLWVKQPGESDGSCRPGAPAAGQWWTQYALGLVAGHS